MVLTLTPAQLQIMQADAEQAYPHEGCGLLLGRFNSGSDNTASRHTLYQVKLLVNAWQPDVAQSLTDRSGDEALTASRRYWIDPQDMLSAQKEARAQGLSIIGVYHSHPDHPAIPSECDRTLAWSDYAYIIVSVHNGLAVDVKCWQLNDQHQFQAKSMIVTDDITDRISPGTPKIEEPHDYNIR